MLGGFCSHAVRLSLLSFFGIYLSLSRQNKRDHDKSVHDFEETLSLSLSLLVSRSVPAVAAWLDHMARVASSAICCTLCGNYPFPFVSLSSFWKISFSFASHADQRQAEVGSGRVGFGSGSARDRFCICWMRRVEQTAANMLRYAQ